MLHACAVLLVLCAVGSLAPVRAAHGSCARSAPVVCLAAPEPEASVLPEPEAAASPEEEPDTSAEETPGEQDQETAPSPSSSPAASARPHVASSARRERLSAFAKGNLVFTSVGQIKALVVKFERNLLYELAPILKNGEVNAVAITMVNRADGNAITRGRLDVTDRGTFHTRTPKLVNACNIGTIDPGCRAKLIAGGTATTRGQMEISGTVHTITATHTRVGDVGKDRTMQVQSEAESADGSVHLSTATTLAADGLPLSAETTGTIAKGPLKLNVTLKLTREKTPSKDKPE